MGQRVDSNVGTCAPGIQYTEALSPTINLEEFLLRGNDPVVIFKLMGKTVKTPFYSSMLVHNPMVHVGTIPTNDRRFILLPATGEVEVRE
jgi:hypothetical protein